ncbi:recombinase family protein [Geosporobacter ferrireducens]|uniref:recombinase family protein n=1 Tax=Geosporobacter ferrireducens TaxID=1424294 RepID=UPI002ED5E510
MQYCIYLRKSRADLDAEARGEGETLVRHERALLELAKTLKLSITHIYKEVVSGETISSRPVMQQLLSDVEQGVWDGVLVMEVERLARGDTVDQGIVAQTFKYSNTKIITPMKIYNPANEFDEEYFEFGLFMSRREYKTINRRLQQGKLQSVKEGKFLGNKSAYGYIRKKIEKNKGYTLEIHPEQVDTVRLIFELYTNGEQQEDGSYRRLGPELIAQKLDSLKILPMKKDFWSPQSIRDILRNPVYIGKIRWNWRPTKKKMVNGEIVKERPRAKEEDIILVDGLHEAIIDMQTWETAQEYMKTNQIGPIPKEQPIKNPLSGIIVCGMCNRKMVRRPYGEKQPDTLMCPAASCKNVSSYLYKVEENILESLEKWVKNYKIEIKKAEDENSVQSNIKEKSFKRLEKEIQKLEKQMDNLHDLLEQGVYTTEKFLERSKIISNRMASLRNDSDLLLEEMERDSLIDKTRKNIIPIVEHVLEVYNATEDPGTKNSLLKKILEKVVYIKESGGRWSNKIDDFQIDLYPKLPKK